jgi:phosphoglycolate phosphatase
MKNDAIIFDIDGTLWNACPTTARAWSVGLSKLGIDKKVSPEDIEKVSGNTIEAAVDILFPGLRTQYPESLDVLSKHEVITFQSYGGTFYEGVIDGIRELSESYKIFLVSNCTDWYMHIFLEKSGIRKVLSGFDCHGMSGLTKDKMIARIIAKHYLRSPVYVGDTASDERAAKIADIEFVHASYGFGKASKEKLSFKSFPDLVNHFMGRSRRKPAKVD